MAGVAQVGSAAAGAVAEVCWTAYEGGRNRGWRAAKSGAAETRAAEASDVETRRSSGGI